MKINLFYIVAGGAVIVGGWTVYAVYFQPSSIPSSANLTASALISGTAGASTSSASDLTSTSTPAVSVPAAAPSISKISTASPAAASSALTPSVPTGLSSIAVTSATIDLSWGASYDAAGVTGYKIFMGGKEIGVTPSQRFEAAKLQASTAYSFTVAAYDQKGVTSAQSSVLTATTSAATAPASSPASAPATEPTSTTTAADTTPPSTPAGVTASAISSSEIDLSWTAATDNVGVTGYEIIVNGTFVATTSGTSYHDTGLSAGTSYSFAIAAYDAAGNVGAQSASVSASTPSSFSGNSTADTTAPSISIATPAAGVTVSSTITISVSASDNVGVTRVEFYVDGSLKGTDSASPYSFSLDTTSLTDGTHSLTAKGYDAAGNIGTSSAIQITVANSAAPSAATSSTTPPSAPKNLAATAVSSSEIDLAWTAPSSPSAGVTGYQIFRDGHPIALGTNAGYNDTGLAAGTTYSYTVRAYIGTPAADPGAQSTGASATTSGG